MKTSATPFSPSRFGTFLSVGLGLAFGALLFGPFMAAGYAPGDLGDARFNTFVLEHVYQFVTGRAAHFASPGIFYPFPGTLFFSDTHVGSAIFYIVLRGLGFSELHAFTLWFFIGYLTTYVAAYYALARMELKPLPAIVAAAVFTFSLPSLAQFGHPQLVYRCGVPLAMLYLWRSLNSGSIADLLRAAIWLFVQMLISIYLGVFLGLLMVSFAAVYLFFEGRSFSEKWIGLIWRDLKRRAVSPDARDIWLALVFAAVSIATAVLLFEYMHVARMYGLHRDWGEISSMLPRPFSYLIMDDLPYWHRLLPSIGSIVPARNEHQMFVGLGVLGLFAAGIWRLRLGQDLEGHALSRAMLVTLLVIALIMLNFGGLFATYSKISLYYLLAKVPGFDAIRAVTRIIVVLMFPISLVAGTGLTMLLYEGKAKIFGVAVGLALVLLAAYEICALTKPVFSIAEADRRVDVIVRQAEAQARGTERPILAVPFPPDIQLDAMLAAQQLGWPTVNGYSGSLVPGASWLPSCGMATAQYLAYEAWQKARNKPPQESVAGMLRRTVFINSSDCSKSLLAP